LLIDGALDQNFPEKVLKKSMALSASAFLCLPGPMIRDAVG